MITRIVEQLIILNFMTPRAGGPNAGRLAELNIARTVRGVATQAIGRSKMGIVRNFVAHGASGDGLSPLGGMFKVTIDTAHGITMCSPRRGNFINLQLMTFLAIIRR